MSGQIYTGVGIRSIAWATLVLSLSEFSAFPPPALFVYDVHTGIQVLHLSGQNTSAFNSSCRNSALSEAHRNEGHDKLHRRAAPLDLPEHLK